MFIELEQEERTLCYMLQLFTLAVCTWDEPFIVITYC